MSTAVPVPAKTPTEKTRYKKWTKPLIDAGYTAIPTIIMHRMGVLRFSPPIIAQLASYWRQLEAAPHPSVRRIVSALGVWESTVKRGVNAVVTAKFLRKENWPQNKNRHQTNVYERNPLIEAITPYALEEVEAIADCREIAFQPSGIPLFMRPPRSFL